MEEVVMNTGFIGLGNLGRAMAGRLESQGVPLVVWNRTRGKEAGLHAAVAANPRSVVAGAETVILNLFDSDAVADVLTGQEGLLKADCTGLLIIDTTTNHFGRVTEFHRLAREHGAFYLEAPVLGSVVPASQGALTILVSGDQAVYERARPVLGLLGKQIYFLGDPGLACRMKLVNNMVLASFMATLAEAAALGEAAGISRDKVLDILAAGGGNSMVLNVKKEKLLREDFSPHFSERAIAKDLRYLQNLADQLHMPLFAGPYAMALFDKAIQRGDGDLDFSAVFRILRRSPG